MEPESTNVVSVSVLPEQPIHFRVYELYENGDGTMDYMSWDIEVSKDQRKPFLDSLYIYWITGARRVHLVAADVRVVMKNEPLQAVGLDIDQIAAILCDENIHQAPVEFKKYL